MRVSIKMKLFFLVLVVLLGAMAAVLWKTSTIFNMDKSLFVREAAQNSAHSIVGQTEERLQSFQGKLATFVSNRESFAAVAGKNEDFRGVLFERLSEVVAVGVVKQDSKGKWKKKWFETNPAGPGAKWKKGYEDGLFAGIKFDALKPGESVMRRLSHPDGKPLFTLLFAVDLQASETSKESTKAKDSEKKAASVEKTKPAVGTRRAVVIGMLSDEVFEKAISYFKVGLNTAFIVDDQGNSYAHTKRDYLGKTLSNEPLVQEIISQKRYGGTGEFLDLEGNGVIGSYEKIKGTNLFAVVTTPQKEAFAAADDLIKSVIVFGLGFALVGLVLTFVFSGWITGPLARLRKIASVIGEGDFTIDVNVKSADEVGDLAQSIAAMRTSLLERDDALDASKKALVQSEKMSAFGQLSAGIAHEVKNPLAGILGHAQLAKGKTDDEDLKKHLDVIEKETRRTKGIIENLMKFARAEKLELVPTNLKESVKMTLDLVDHQLSLMGVTISHDLKNIPLIEGNANQLQQVFLNFMVNAGHAMDKSDEKLLHVSLVQKDDIARVSIKDTGSGMTEETKKKIFEPFFTTKPTGKGTGLGLSVSFGILKDHKATVTIESEVGKGTEFFLDFPIPKGAEMPVDFDKKADSPPEPVDSPEAEGSEEKLEVVQESGQTEEFRKEDVEEAIEDLMTSEETKAPTLGGKEPAEGAKSLDALPSSNAKEKGKTSDSSEDEFKVNIRRPKMKG